MLRIACLAALIATSLAAPVTAHAKSLPDNRTLEAKVTLFARQTTVTTYRNGRTERSNSKRNDTTKLRIFKLKGDLIVSMGDFQAGTAFTNDTARTKNNRRATKDRFSCKQITWEGGGKTKLCLKYVDTAKGFTLFMNETGFTEDGKLRHEEEYNFELMPNDCLARAKPSTQTWDNADAINYPQTVKSAFTTVKFTFNGSSCKLLKGKQQF